MKGIEWLAHAKQRLKDRSLDIHFVEASIKQPDQIVTEGRQKIVHKKYRDSQRHKNYLLRVFLEEYSDKIVVRSVYRTSKIQKYWKGALS